MTKQKVSIELISGKDKAKWEESYVVIRELYKLEQPFTRGKLQMHFVGIREIWKKSLIFKDTLEDTDKFMATASGECYSYVDGSHYSGTSELMKDFMGRSVSTDDFSDLVGKSERIV